MSLHDLPRGKAIYRSKDPTSNLKIRITLRRVTLGKFLPNRSLTTNDDDTTAIHDENAAAVDSGDAFIEECVVQWQDKLFSQRELELYRRPENCSTPLEKSYCERIRQREADAASSPPRAGRLFTYVNNDAFEFDQNFGAITTSANESLSYLSARMQAAQLSKLARRRPDPTSLNSFVNDGRRLDRPPNPERLVQRADPSRRVPQRSLESMHIMADLRPENSTASGKFECLLASISIDQDGVISVQPDFNSANNPYLIQTPDGTRDLYEYVIEHASERIEPEQAEQEAAVFKQLYGRHAAFLQTKIGKIFSLPRHQELRYFLTGDFVHGSGFDYDELFIHFMIDLPRRWSCTAGSVSEMTQVSARNGKGVHHFSFPFERALSFDGRSDASEGSSTLQVPCLAWPQLLFEVVAYERRWKRYRVEGYGALTLPTVAGTTTHRCRTWRPLGNGFQDEMRRFFVGGAAELDDLAYVAIPTGTQGKLLSKYGLMTTSSGEITLRLGVLLQSQEFMGSLHDKRVHRRNRLRGLQISKQESSIHRVVQALQLARQQLMQAQLDLFDVKIPAKSVSREDSGAAGDAAAH